MDVSTQHFRYIYMPCGMTCFVLGYSHSELYYILIHRWSEMYNYAWRLDQVQAKKWYG